MKNLGLGLICGSIIGAFVSCLKNDNGKRFGAPIKENFDGIVEDAENIQENIIKAKDASARLNKTLPAAERAIDDIATDIDRYQTHISYTTDEIEKSAEALKNKLEREDN